MNTKPFTLENHFKLFDNGTGSYITIGPDKDGSGLIEIVDSENELCSIVLHTGQARLLVDALTLLIPEMEKEYEE
jgi:hypothetical protein